MIRTKREYTDYLRDILDAIDKAEKFTAGMDSLTFEAADKTIFAVVRALEIIGEVTKKLPDPLKERYLEIPWREMAGMRDKVIHDYFGVNLRRIFETVRQDLPPLHESIAHMLSNGLNTSDQYKAGEKGTHCQPSSMQT